MRYYLVVILSITFFSLFAQDVKNSTLLNSQITRIIIDQNQKNKTYVIAETTKSKNTLFLLGGGFEVLDYQIQENIISIVFRNCSKSVESITVRFFQYNNEDDSWSPLISDVHALKNKNGILTCENSFAQMGDSFTLKFGFLDEKSSDSVKYYPLKSTKSSNTVDKTLLHSEIEEYKIKNSQVITLKKSKKLRAHCIK